jgi:PKD repeat protein
MRPFRRPDPTEERDRAQLILVSALALATTLVALSLVVNSVIYTENLATRRNADTGQALNFREASHDGGVRALEVANFAPADATFLERKTTLRDALAAWETSSSRYFARRGRDVGMSAASFVEGTRVSQDTVGPFVPASSNVVYHNNSLDLLGLGETETWVAANESSIRRFRMEVERDSRLYETSQSLLADGGDTILTGNEVYALYVRDANDDAYRVYVYENTSVTPNEVSVAVYDEQAADLVAGSCHVPGDTVDIDVTGGTLSGDAGTESCEALSFWEDTQGPYDLYHLNGNRVAGTYSFVGDRAETEFRDAVEVQNEGFYDTLLSLFGTLTKTEPDDDETYATSDGSTVYTTPAIYATDVTVSYRTGGLDYASSVRLAPGEPGEQTTAAGGGGGGGGGGDANAAPDAQFSVSDTSVPVGNAVDFDASASSDADGSVQSYEWSYDDGDVDTGATVSHSFASAGTYDVTLTVTDDDGDIDSRTRTVQVVSSSSTPPEFTSTSLDDQSVADGGADKNEDRLDFVVDWTVEDTDGDLSEVRLELVQTSNGKNKGFIDSVSASVGGTSADSSLSVGADLKKACEETYELTLTVQDGETQTDTETWSGVTASC